VFQEDRLSFDQQSPASAFCERTACLFTVLGQLTADPKNRKMRGGKANKNEKKMKMARVSDRNNSLVSSGKTGCLLTSRDQQVPSVKG
jgi:hypothetical protein